MSSTPPSTFQLLARIAELEAQVAEHAAARRRAEEQLHEQRRLNAIVRSEREQAEAALRSAATVYHSLVENSPDVIARLDRECRILFVSPNVERLTGVTAADHLGRTGREVGMPPQMFDPFSRAVAAVFAAGAAQTFEYNGETPAGHGSYELRIVPERGAGGAVETVLVISRDTTEQRRAAEALGQSERRLRVALDAASMVAWEWDIASDRTFWIGDADLILGTRGVTAAGLSRLNHLIPPEDHAAVQATVQSIRENDEFRLEHRIYRSDGSVGWIESYARVIARVAAGPARLVGVSRDITRRKRLESELRRREQQFSALVENSPDVIFRHRIVPNIGYEYVSPAVLRVTGYPPQAFLADPYFLTRIVHPEDRPIIERMNAERSVPSPLVLRLRHREGQLLWVELSTSALHGADGEVVAYEGIFHDITAHKQLEQTLLRQARLQAMLAASLQILHSHGHDEAARQRIFTAVAMQLCQGVEAAHILIWALEGESRLRLRAAADAAGDAPQGDHVIAVESLPAAAQGLLQSGDHMQAPCVVPAFTPLVGGDAHHYLLPIGWHGVRWGLVAVGLRQPAGLDAESLALAATVVEIAATTVRRWRAVDALQQNERQMRLAIEAARLGTWVLHFASGQISLSEENARIMGLGETAMTVGFERIVDATHPDDRVAVQKQLRQAIAAREPLHIQSRVLHPDGSLRWVQVLGQVFSDPADPHGRMFGVVLDATAQREAQAIIERAKAVLERRVRQRTQELAAVNRELEDSSALLRTIINSLDDGLVLLDGEGRILMVNRAVTALCRLGQGEIIGRPWFQVCPFRSPLIDRALAEGLAFSGRERVTREGEAQVFDIQAFPLRTAAAGKQTVIHLVDITARLHFEELTIKNERLAATGRLAAVVAHEVNSPLQAIQNFLFLASSDDPAERDGYLRLIADEIDRIGGLIRRLLDLQRPDDAVVRRLDVNAIVAKVLTLTSSTMERHRVRIVRDLTSDAVSVTGRNDQLTQVLLNILLNALDAMPHGGELCVESRRRAPDPEDGFMARQPAEVAVIRVADTGEGIPEAALQRIFEPFYTTKPSGSGLGLAISRQIIEQHGGTLSARNRDDRGAVFTITLPVVEPGLDEAHAGGLPPSGSPRP